MLSERRFLLEYEFPHLIVRELAKPASWGLEYMKAIKQTGAWQDENPEIGGFVSGSRSGFSLCFDSPPARALHQQLIPDISYIDERTWCGLEEKDKAYVCCIASVVVMILSNGVGTFKELQTKVSTLVAAGVHEGVVVDTCGDRVWIHNCNETPYEVHPLASVEFESWPGFTLDCLAMRDARERAGL